MRENYVIVYEIDGITIDNHDALILANAFTSFVGVVLQRQQVYGTSEDTNDHPFRPQVNPREAQVVNNPCTNEN